MKPNLSGVDWPVFLLSGGFIVSFVLLALIDINLLSELVNSFFALSAKYFGAYWQLLLLATFLTGIGVAISSCGRVRLGNLPEPDISTFKWIAIIMCTLLAGGGVFWAAAEPVSHFVSPPPLYGVEAKTTCRCLPRAVAKLSSLGFSCLVDSRQSDGHYSDEPAL